MSSRTKKPLIDPKSREDAENLETTFDLYKNLSDYERMIKEDNNRRKSRMAREIESMGEVLLDEIEAKNVEKERERVFFVRKIIETTNEFGGERILNQMTHEELRSIYIQIEEDRKPWYRKLFEFFMG